MTPTPKPATFPKGNAAGASFPTFLALSWEILALSWEILALSWETVLLRGAFYTPAPQWVRTSPRKAEKSLVLYSTPYGGTERGAWAPSGLAPGRPAPDSVPLSTFRPIKRAAPHRRARAGFRGACHRARPRASHGLSMIRPPGGRPSGRQGLRPPPVVSGDAGGLPGAPRGRRAPRAALAHPGGARGAARGRGGGRGAARPRGASPAPRRPPRVVAVPRVRVPVRHPLPPSSGLRRVAVPPVPRVAVPFATRARPRPGRAARAAPRLPPRPSVAVGHDARGPRATPSAADAPAHLRPPPRGVGGGGHPLRRGVDRAGAPCGIPVTSPHLSLDLLTHERAAWT